MYAVKIAPAAIQDIKMAAAWYNGQQSGLGKRFTNSIRTKVMTIQNHPYAFSVKYRNVRATVTDTFPFLIHYIIDDAEKSILIIAILHTSRKPG